MARDPDGRIIALGEARWGPVTPADAVRLRRIRALLAVSNPEVAEAQLLLFTGHDGPAELGDVRRIGLDTLYGDA